MKRRLGTICLLLASVNFLSAQPAAVSDVKMESGNRHLDLPHINQGQGTSYCGPSVFLTALQADTGLNLSDKRLLPQLSALINREIGAGKVACRPQLLLPLLDVDFTTHDYNGELKARDPGIAKELALKTLRQDFIPGLLQGNYYHIQVTNGYNGHAILIVDYDPKEDKLVIYDPLRHQKYLESVEGVSGRWPIHYPEDLRKKYSYIGEDRFYLRCDQIRTAQKPVKTAPLHCEVQVRLDALSRITLKQDFSLKTAKFDDFRSSVEGPASWRHLSNYWDKDRTPQEVPGVATAFKIKVAQGEPALTLYSKSEDNHLLVAVTGYKGGIANPEAEIQITLVNEGKLFSRWISSNEFASKCIPKSSDGRYCAFIGYPENPLTEKVIVEAGKQDPLAVTDASIQPGDRPMKELILQASWIKSNGREGRHSFTADGNFASANAKATYKITGRRELSILWDDYEVLCLMNEDCTKMTELNGAKSIWIHAPPESGHE